MEDGRPVDKRGKVFHRDDLQIIYLFSQILRFTTNMRALIMEDTFDHFPAIILRDDALEGLVGEGCSREEDGIGNGLGK